MSESIAKKVAAASNSGNEERKKAANAAKEQKKGKTAKAAESNLAREFGAAIRQFPTSYPGGITPETLFDERTERIIKAQADRLVTTGLFEQQEREDVENELRVVLAYEMAKYDPAKDRYTFAATVLAKRGVNAIIKRRNYLRDNPRPLSLDEPINGENGETFLDIIPSDDLPADEIVCRKEELNNRIEKLLASLAPRDRDICMGVMEGKGLLEIARNVGMTHSSVFYRLRVIIAGQAVKCGLHSQEVGL